jgi:glycosyltransferase involved in cell wall biosynthesis
MLTSDNEGTPVSLIEAQAAAVPIVSTDVGGVRAVIRDGETGLLAGVADEDALLRAAFRLVSHPATGQAMAHAGREHVSAFGLERLVSDVDRLYARLLEERATRR